MINYGQSVSFVMHMRNKKEIHYIKADNTTPTYNVSESLYSTNVLLMYDRWVSENTIKKHLSFVTFPHHLGGGGHKPLNIYFFKKLCFNGGMIIRCITRVNFKKQELGTHSFSFKVAIFEQMLIPFRVPCFTVQCHTGAGGLSRS